MMLPNKNLHHPTQHNTTQTQLQSSNDAVSMSEPGPEPKPSVVCCVGDIHGYITKLQNLWSNLQSSVPPSDFENALIIFLGDYCDRGPDTKRVLDFLISLPSKYPNQTHVFLCGNHDLSFAAFLGVLPTPADGSSFADTWKEYESVEWWENWYKGEGYENMHLQGRRWGGSMSGFMGSMYDSATTFESYGVPHASPELKKVVPDEHKKFLAELVWVHEEENVWIETEDGLQKYKMIAVHAGLEEDKSVEEQLKYLRAKDTRIPRVDALSGRRNVWKMPKELEKTPTIVISGHHGKLYTEDLRLIIDEGGGMPDNPVAAIVFPSKKMVRDTD